MDPPEVTPPSELKRSGSLVRSYSNAYARGQPAPYAVQFGVYQEQGLRKSMEDNHIADTALTSDHGCNGVFLVCDGHGGDQCSRFVADKLIKEALEHKDFGIDMTSALTEAIMSVEQQWLDMAVAEELDGGTTVLLAFFLKNKIFVANVGDSEGVLCRDGKAVPMANVHNMKKNAAETKRVIDMGGRVHRKRIGHPVFNPSFFSIGVSRAIGDIFYKVGRFTKEKPSGLIADPEIRVLTINPVTDTFCIMACDGLWDVLTHQEALDFVMNIRETHTGDSTWEGCAKRLTKLALEKGSRDNVTVIVVGIGVQFPVPV